MDNLVMNAIELIGDVDDDHRLHVEVPKEVPAGSVRLIVLLPGEDAAGGMWARGIAADWSAELQDAREDIYTLNDGQPVNAPRRDLLSALSVWRCSGYEVASGAAVDRKPRASLPNT